MRPVIFLSASLIILSSQGLCLAKSIENGLVMDRQNVFGRATLYVDNRGARFEYPKIQYSVLSKPPKWDVIHFNTGSRKLYTETAEQFFRRSGFQQTDSSSIKKLKPIRFRRDGFTQYKFSIRGQSTHTLDSPLVLPRVVNTDREFITERQFVFSEPANLPDQALRFLCTFYRAPNFQGIPLSLDEKLNTGRIKHVWYTYSIKRQPISSKLFDLPEGYTLCRSQMEVYGGSLNAPLEELFKDLGVGKKFGASRNSRHHNKDTAIIRQ